MMKQKDIAAAVDLSKSYVSELVNTKKRPSYKTAKKLFKFTGIKALVWLEGSPEEIKQALKESHVKGE